METKFNHAPLIVIAVLTLVGMFILSGQAHPQSPTICLWPNTCSK